MPISLNKLPGHCPLSDTFALRNFSGKCSKCGRKVKVKMNGRIPLHKAPKNKD